MQYAAYWVPAQMQYAAYWVLVRCNMQPIGYLLRCNMQPRETEGPATQVLLTPRPPWRQGGSC
eukprot:365779-Chlamydomonas_euryale.AAC.4